MFEAIAEKVKTGQPLTAAEVEALAATPDLITLGMLADEARRRRHGDTVTFCRVAEVVISAEDLVRVDMPAAAGELRLIGRPRTAAAAADIVRSAIDAAGDVPVSAFSLADLVVLAGSSPSGIDGVLAELRRAGLETISEAPIDVLADPVTALAAVRNAGLRVARLTIHSGPGEDDHGLLALVNGLVAADSGLKVFAPLPRLAPAERPSTGYEDVKMVALARLAVDAIETIQVDWALYGPKLAQVALTFGANDVDAVSPHDSQELGPRRAPLPEIRRNILAASFVPVERNGRFVAS